MHVCTMLYGFSKVRRAGEARLYRVVSSTTLLQNTNSYKSHSDDNMVENHFFDNSRKII